MTRTELERDRRAKVVRDAIKWGDSPNLVHKSRLAVDALDLLDAEDRASFEQEQAVQRMERITANAGLLGAEQAQFRGLRETLYGDLGKANEAPADDWSFFKGVLLGFFIAVALFTGLMYGLTRWE